MQDAILAATLTSDAPRTAITSAASMLDEDDDKFAQLSPSQAREFYSGCGEKTRKALEVIAKSDSRQFHLADVAEAVGAKPDELRGVWGGLKRRLYTVADNNDCYLINWERHDPVHDNDDNYIDHIGEVSELTYQAFRKLLVK